MPRKLILCRCEDVTAADVEQAIAAGFDDLEEVKRYTGFGTGPCQGKECLRAVALAIAAATGQPPDTIRPFTTRPPLGPTALRLLDRPARRARPPAHAATAEARLVQERGDRGGDAPATATAPPPTAHGPPLPRSADIVIVGGGVMGLAIAYNLARLGITRVAVLEASTIAYGASGRNGGGLRQQWSTEMNILLMRESLEICDDFARDMHINVWMRQGGYLFLIRSEATRAEIERSIALQNRCDVPTRLISMTDARDIVPELDTSPFIAASYNPTDAVVFPWPFLWGYAAAARKLGVTIHTGVPVTVIERREDTGSGAGFVVRTPAGDVTAGRVLNAAGAWSPRVAALVGLTLPNWPARHEILSTEPLKPFLKPMVSVLESGLYFSQSLRGELVGGIALPEPRTDQIRMGSRLAFLQAMSAGLLEVMPRLGDVKVVRQWAGPYDMTTDGNPIVGEAPGVPGFFLCCGFMGHGFMMAPVVAKYYALHLAGKQTHPFFHKWRLARFAEGDLEPESMIIG